CWVPRKYRARAVATTMLAVPVSVVLGGPLSGWLLAMQTPFDVAAWRWMFFIEGLPAVLLAFVALRVFRHEPAGAPWLDKQEQDWLAREFEDEEQRTEQGGIRSFRE